METIAAQPNGFVKGSGLYDLDTGRFAVAAAPSSASRTCPRCSAWSSCAPSSSTWSTCRRSRRRGWSTAAVQRHQGRAGGRYGSDFGNLILFQGHSRLDAYAAVQTGDAKLATRAWDKFYNSDGYKESAPWKTEPVSGPVTLVRAARPPGCPPTPPPCTAWPPSRTWPWSATRCPRNRNTGARPRRVARGEGGDAGTLHPWTGPLPLPQPLALPAPRRRRLRRAGARRGRTPAGGPRCARSTRLDDTQRRRPLPLAAAVRPDLHRDARCGATRAPGCWRSGCAATWTAGRAGPQLPGAGGTRAVYDQDVEVSKPLLRRLACPAAGLPRQPRADDARRRAAAGLRSALPPEAV